MKTKWGCEAPSGFDLKLRSDTTLKKVIASSRAKGWCSAGDTPGR